ncbi:ISAs1 family transposase, partial [Glycomyces arizonensis]
MRDKTLTLDVWWTDFAGHVAQIPDPRSARGVRHPFGATIALACAAMLAGRNSIASIERWARDAPQAVLAAAGARNVNGPFGTRFYPPGYDTFRRLLGEAVPEGVASLAAAARQLAFAPDDQIRIDGKRLRGAAPGKIKPLLVAAHDSADRALGQVLALDNDEHAAARHLIDILGLETALISADALHWCAETAQVVIDRGFDYLLCCKGNRPELFAQINALPWAGIDNAWEARGSGHGRDETRTIKILAVGGAVRIGFPGAAQVARVRRWRRDRRTGESSHETVYYLTSRDFRALRPAEFAAAVRRHWGIEAWHWLRDMVFGEDASNLRSGFAPQNLASLRNLAIAVLKAVGGQCITALRDRIANHPYTLPLEILGLALIEQTFQPRRLCLRPG